MTWLLIILAIIAVIVGGFCVLLYEIFSGIGFVLENIFSGLGQVLPKIITGIGLALDTISSGIGKFFGMVFSSTLGKVISLITILSIVVIVIVGCLIYEAQRPMSEKVAVKIEQYEESLLKTVDLLNKRKEQSNEAQQNFIDECECSSISVDKVIKELQKNDSGQKTKNYLKHVYNYWSEWKDIERDVAILSHQKERLETNLEDMTFLLRKLKRIEETGQVYIKGDDPVLDAIIARVEVDTSIGSDAPYKDLSSAEKTEIDIEVSNKMQEAIENSNTN